MKKSFPTLALLLLLHCNTLLAHAPIAVNDDFTALFNSLANKLDDAKGEMVSADELNKKEATVYETELSLDDNLAYIVFENSGIRYHQTIFGSDSDRLSLLDDLNSYEGDYSIHQLTNQSKNEVYKIKKGRNIIGFLQFRKNKSQWSLMAYTAFDQANFQSNLELVLQSGINDFSGIKSNVILNESKDGIRYKCNLQLYGAASTSFFNLYDGQVYSIDGNYVNLPFPILKTHLEKINAFTNGFQIDDREAENRTYKLYLSYQNTEYILAVGGTNKTSILSISKNRLNSVTSTPAPKIESPSKVETNQQQQPLVEESTSQIEPTSREHETELESESVSTETTEPNLPALESGTYAFVGKAGQMGCYIGTVENGKRQGKGVFIAKDGTEWEGEWDNDELVGTVIIRKNTGDVYEGEVRNYQRHGFGSYIWINSGNRFEGDWENDQRDGKAKYFISKSERRFEGTYVDNRIHGTGTWHYKDGSQLTGNFNKGKKEGAFTAIAPDGTRQKCTYERGRLVSSGPVRLMESYGSFECDYIKGLKHGPAKIIYHNGTVEERNYKYGKLDGIVRCTYPDGKVQELEYKGNQLLNSGHLKIKHEDGFFEGDFKAGLKQGPGILFYDNEVVEDGNYKVGKKEGAFTLVSPNGDVQILPYKNDKLIHTGKARLFYADGYFDGKLNNGIKNGKGKMVYNNGNVLEGEWTNEEKEGQFKMTYANGKVAQQVYAADKLQKTRIVKDQVIDCANNSAPSRPTTRPPVKEVIKEEHQPVEEKEIVSQEEPEEVALSPEEMVEQFILNFKDVAKERKYTLARHTKGSQIHKYAALATNAFFDEGKEYLYLVVFKDCSECDVTMGRGKGDDIQYKKAQIKHEGSFTYAIYSFKSLESNTKPIWAFPDPDEKDGEALLFVR